MNDGFRNYMRLFSDDAQRSLLSVSDFGGAEPLQEDNLERSGFLQNVGVGAVQSIGLRTSRRIRRSIDIGITDGTSRPIDPDEWFEGSKELFLQDGVRGRFIVDRYLAGAYDSVSSEAELLAALAYDYEEGDRLEVMSRASGLGIVGQFAGTLLDPSNYVLAYALPIVAGTAKGLAGSRGIAAGAQAGRTAAVSNAGVIDSLKLGAQLSAVQTTADILSTPEQETFAQFAGALATDIAADATLTYAFKALAGGRRWTGKRLEELKTKIGDQNNQLANALADGMDAELGHIAAGQELPPPAPVATPIAIKQHEALDGLPQTAEIRQLRRAVDEGLSEEGFAERLDLIKKGAGDLKEAPLFAVELGRTEADGTVGVARDVEGGRTNVAAESAPEVASVDSRRTFELPPEPDRIDPGSGRPIYDLAQDAKKAKDAEGTLFPTTLSSQIDELSPDQMADAVLALSPEEVSQLNRVMSAIEQNQAVPFEDYNEHVAEALEKINNRSPNLSWNPARLGDPRGTFSVKIDQPVNATVVGFTPTSNLEDLMLSLKKLGLRKGGEAGAEAPPSSFTGGHVRRGAGGQWHTTDQADEVAEKLLAFSGRAKDETDLTPDFRNDAVRQYAEKVSNGKISAENKGLVGWQSAWGPFANRLVFSKNPVISHLFNVIAKSDVHSKGVAENYRLGQPLEAIGERNRLAQSRQQQTIERGFISALEVIKGQGFRKKAGRWLRSSNGILSVNLMTKGERDLWDKFNHLLEMVRIADEQLPVSGGRIPWLEARAGKDWISEMAVSHEWLTPSIRWGYTPEISESLRKTFIEMIRSNQRLSDAPTVARMANETTTLDINPDITYNELTILLRDLQGLDRTATPHSIFDVYLRMTDGKNPAIARADFENALKGDTDKFVRTVVNLHNQRFRGIVPISNTNLVTGGFLNTVRDTRLELPTKAEAQAGIQRSDVFRQNPDAQRPIVTYNAYDSIAVRWQANARLEWAESLARSSAILRDLERQGTPNYDGFDPTLDGYANVVRWRSEGKWREFTDGVEQWLDQAIDAHVTHAKRWANLKVKDTKQRKKLEKDAEYANTFAKMMIGHNEARIMSEAQKAGLAVRDFAGITTLGRQVFSQAPEVMRAINRATALGTAKSMNPIVKGIQRDIKKMAERGDDLGLLLNQVQSIQEGMSFHISRKLDVSPEGIEADAIPMPTLADRVGTWTRVKGRGMIFVGSLGKYTNDVTSVAGTLIANERFTLDIPKAIRVEQRLKNGEDVLAAVKAEKLGYPEYQYIRRYLGEDSINRLNSIFESGSKEKITKSNGREVVEIWTPRDKADETAIREYAGLLAQYADRQVRFVPQASDFFIDGNPNSVVLGWVSQFLKPTIAGANGLHLARANAGVRSRFVDISTTAFLAWVGAYLRNATSGRGERFEEEMQTTAGLARQVNDALGYSGFSGWIPDRFGVAFFTTMFGENEYRARGNVEFAVDTPVQSTAKNVLSAIGGAFSKDGPTPYQTVWLRRITTAGLSDTVMAHVLRIVFDESGLDEELGFDEFIDWLYPEASSQN